MVHIPTACSTCPPSVESVDRECMYRTCRMLACHLAHAAHSSGATKQVRPFLCHVQRFSNVGLSIAGSRWHLFVATEQHFLLPVAAPHRGDQGRHSACRQRHRMRDQAWSHTGEGQAIDSGQPGDGGKSVCINSDSPRQQRNGMWEASGRRSRACRPSSLQG